MLAITVNTDTNTLVGIRSSSTRSQRRLDAALAGATVELMQKHGWTPEYARSVYLMSSEGL